MLLKIVHGLLFVLFVFVLTYVLLSLALDAALREQEVENEKMAKLCLQWEEEGSLTEEKLAYCH